MKPMLRRVSMLLCVVTLLSLMLTAIGCGKSDTTAEQTTAATTDAAATTTASQGVKRIMPMDSPV